jgi:hypothetical protein
MPDQMYFEIDVLMYLNLKSVPRNIARNKFVDDGRSTRGNGLRRFGVVSLYYNSSRGHDSLKGEKEKHYWA